MKNFVKIIKNKKILIFDIIAILLISLYCYSISPKTLQNDTYYTVTIGNLITENGIDMKDHFSWHENLPYTYPHWLYDVIMSKIYNLAGWNGIYISVCVLTIILGIVVYIVNTKLAKSKIVSFALTIGVMYLLKGYIAARAQLVTFILFTLAIYLIEKFLTNPKKIYYGIGIVLISVLIVNLHVAVWLFLFVLSLPYIAEYIIAIFADFILYSQYKIWKYKIDIKFFYKNNKDKIEKIKEKIENIEIKNEKIKLKREDSEPYKIKMTRNKNVKWLILVMLICGLTGLISPIGDTPYTYLYKTITGNTMENINEHLPLTLINSTPIMCSIVIILALFTFTKTKIRLSDLFMLVGLTYLMFKTKRQVTMFALIGSIILNRMIVEALETYSKYKIKELSNKYINAISSLIIAILVTFLSKGDIQDKINDDFVDNKTYPVEAADWILENLDVSNIRMFNEYNYGSYLLYKEIPVFIDSRADLYAPEFNGIEGVQEGRDIFMDFINTSSISDFYGETFKKYNITHVLLYKNSKIKMIIDKTEPEKYEKIYSDKHFVLYKVLEY